MEIKDGIQVRGEVSLVLRDATTMKVKTRRDISNLVVQGGKDLIAANFAGNSADTVTHVAVGGNSPTTAANISQTALVDPFTPRVSATETVNAGPASIVYEATFGAGVVVNTIGEAGLFTASTGGIMVARTTFPAIPKGANDLLTVTWTLIFG